MVYQYNDVSLTYNATTSTYNGDPIGVLTLDVNVFDAVQISENITFLQDLLVFAPAPYIESLFTHYKWNDNAPNQVIADNIGGINGLWVNGNTDSNSTTGKINEALDFNGLNDYMSAPDTPNFNLTTFSYAAWLQNSTVGIFEQRILSKKLSVADTDGYEISLYYDGGGYYLKVVSGVSTTSFNTGVNWSVGDWHQIVVIFDGTTVYAYCDNVSLGSGVIDLILPNTNNLLFGKIDDEAVTIWSGKMDDTRFYNQTLTLGEIDFLWNSGNGTEYDSEYLAISEYINVSMSSSNSLFEAVDISEVIILTGQLGDIDVYSSLELTEEVTIRSQLGDIDVYSSLELTEEVTISSQPGDIDVYDELELSEFIFFIGGNNIFIYESLEITEDVTIEMGQLGDISVYDELEISENFIDSLQLDVNVYDEVDVSEEVMMEMSQLGDIDIYDEVDISENFINTGELTVNTYEVINLSEDVTLEMSQLGDIDVYDELNISETITTDGQLGGVDMYDEVNLSADVTMDMGQLGGINVYETVNISENFKSAGTMIISVQDTVNLSIVVAVHTQLSDISVNDTINLSETVTVVNPSMEINTFSTILLTENIVNSGTLYLSIIDGVNISTNFTEAMSTLQASTFDQVNITESITTEGVIYLSVYDQVNTTELVAAESFRFSPASSRPVGGVNTMIPVSNLSGYA
jgi:hypothetical protein